MLTGFLRDLPGVVLLASHDRVLLDDVCTDLVDLDPTAFGTDGQGGRRFGGGWSDYVASREDARRRWEETYADQQDELDRLRAATKIGTAQIAHNRGPTDNDKFIYKAKGAKVESTLSRRKRDARRRLDLAERDQVRKPPKPLVFRGTAGRGDRRGRLVQVRDLVVAGRLGWTASTSRQASTCSSRAPTGPASRRCSACWPAGWSRRPARSRSAAGSPSSPRTSPSPDRPSRARRRVRRRGGRHSSDAPALRDLGLVHPRDHHRPVGLLSVGQRRRLGLAVAVAQAPRPDAARRAHQPPVPGTGRRDRGGARPQSGRRRRRVARPLAAPALGGIRPRAGVSRRRTQQD